jgi:hypothetical protein
LLFQQFKQADLLHCTKARTACFVSQTSYRCIIGAFEIAAYGMYRKLRGKKLD